MRKFIALALILFALTGCSSQPMPEDWAPITTIVERLQPNEGVVTTISPFLIVKDIDEFWEKHPKGSAQLEALRRHETVHARSQESYANGKVNWLIRYTTEKKFRWKEEKAGYKAGILYLHEQGFFIDPVKVAKILSGLTYGYMVSYEEAHQWALDVLMGRD